MFCNWCYVIRGFPTYLCFSLSLLSTAVTQYTYTGNTGPEFWPLLFPEECAGDQQSPIALNLLQSEFVKLEGFKFINYEMVPTSVTILNNGHTAQVSFDLPGMAILSGGGLPGDFEFQQLHFHWGSDSRKGSEHIHEGVQYPMELHLVHKNIKYVATSEAVHHADGLAVVAIFLDIDELDNPILEPIIKHLPEIRTEGLDVTIPYPFSLLDYFSFETSNFYRYTGSLTTPTCNEAVVWTVFTKTLPISERQINVFRNLLNNDNEPLVDNFRPIQLVNDRTVYRNGLVETNSPISLEDYLLKSID